MKTKKIASLLLAGLLALSVAACGQQQAVTNNDQGTSSDVSTTSEASSDLSSSAEAGQTGERPTEPSGQLVIGSITQVINEFYDTGFSTSETNYNMYDLIHGTMDSVVYSKEVPCKIVGEDHVPGSVSFVPPVSGMMMAGYAVRKLLEEHMPKQG